MQDSMAVKRYKTMAAMDRAAPADIEQRMSELFSPLQLDMLKRENVPICPMVASPRNIPDAQHHLHFDVFRKKDRKDRKVAIPPIRGATIPADMAILKITSLGLVAKSSLPPPPPCVKKSRSRQILSPPAVINLKRPT